MVFGLEGKNDKFFLKQYGSRNKVLNGKNVWHQLPFLIVF